MRARLRIRASMQRADVLRAVRTTREQLLGDGICRTTSSVSSLITVMTVRPLPSSTLKRKLRCLLLMISLSRSTAVATSTAARRLGDRQNFAGRLRTLPCRRQRAGAAGSARNRRRRRPCGCRGNWSQVTHHGCHLFGCGSGPRFRPARQGGTPTTCRPTSTSHHLAGSVPRSSLLTAAAPARSAAPRWPAPESRHRPAAGSAPSSGSPSRPRSPRREFGCATLRGSR